MAIKNYTGARVSFVRADDTTSTVTTIQPATTAPFVVAALAQHTVSSGGGSVIPTLEEYHIPLMRTEILEILDLPRPEEGVLYLVSRGVRDAITTLHPDDPLPRPDILVPADPVPGIAEYYRAVSY